MGDDPDRPAEVSVLNGIEIIVHSERCTLTASDGHQLTALRVEPAQPAALGVVLLHELFGLTPYIKSVAEAYASLGYRVVVPELFDRIAPGQVFELSQMEAARAVVGQLDSEQMLLDIEAAAELARAAAGVAVVGYCWGGGVAYYSACHLDINSAVSMYGTRIPSYLGAALRCPVQFHFGECDSHASADDIEQIRSVHPEQSLYIYPGAGHAFADPQRPAYDAACAELAQQRIVDFLNAHHAA